MDLKYSKYFHSMLCFFVENDENAILKKVKEILNDPAEFYYNYDANDLKKRTTELFDRMLNQYANVDLSGQHYKAIWHVLHTIPLITSSVKNSKYIEYFYEDFVLEHVQCLNCITHYISTIVNHPEIFEDVDVLFNEFVGLHNVINQSRGKNMKNDSELKKLLTNEIQRIYPDFYNNIS